MNLHEYQSKQIFAEYKLPVSRGIACQTVEEGLQAMKTLGGKEWVVKCQVHAGGRGKAGGVKLVQTEEQLTEFFNKWLGKRLVTFQTDANGQPVNTIYVEEASDLEKELYVGMVIDRSSQSVVFMASTEGGVNIEEVAAKTPHFIT